MFGDEAVSTQFVWVNSSITDNKFNCCKFNVKNFWIFSILGERTNNVASNASNFTKKHKDFGNYSVTQRYREKTPRDTEKNQYI